MAESDKESPKGSLSVKWESEDKATWLPWGCSRSL